MKARVLVLLPGWGQPPEALASLGEALPVGWEARALALPGHGGHPWPQGWDPAAPRLEAWSDALARELPPGAVLAGWSLGGLVALDLALRRPERLAGLVLLAATPRLAAAPGWPGIPLEDLQDVAEDLREEPRRALGRFRALMARGRPALARALRAAERRPAPDPRALWAGLALLAGCDLRPGLPGLGVPTLVLLGDQDPLIPAASKVAWEEVPAARCLVLRGVGHLPHLEAPGPCAQALGTFLRNLTAPGAHAASGLGGGVPP